MVGAAAKEETLSVVGKGGGRDAEADVLLVESRAAFVIEKSSVPVAFKEAASHEEELAFRVEGERFHQALPDFTIGGGAFFFGTIFPGKPLPELFAVSRSGISGGAHADEVE